MAIIGIFKPSRAGGWEGEIRTLTLNLKVRLTPNDDRVSANGPAFRVMAGRWHIGDAWEVRTRADPPTAFVRVRLDDPLLPGPLWAALFADEEQASARLVWTRPVKAVRVGPP